MNHTWNAAEFINTLKGFAKSETSSSRQFVKRCDKSSSPLFTNRIKHVWIYVTAFIIHKYLLKSLSSSMQPLSALDTDLLQQLLQVFRLLEKFSAE